MEPQSKAWACRWIAVLMVPCAISIMNAESLAAQMRTDDELYREAFTAYSARDHVTAGILLYAYLQRNPIVLTNDPTLSSKVQGAYNWAVDATRTALRNGEVAQARVKELERQKGEGSSSQGLTNPPPVLPPPRAGAGPRGNIAIIAGQRINTGGQWNLAMHSAVSGADYTGEVSLEFEAGAVSGTINIRRVGVRGLRGIVGAVGDSIDFVRDTGAETIQHFRVARSGAELAGRFWNAGRYPDSGSVVLRRP